MARSRSRAFGSVLLGSPHQSSRALRVRVQLLLTFLLIGTNVVGAGVVFCLSALVIPAPSPNSGMVLALAIGVPVYVAVAIGIGMLWGTAGALRALRWANNDQEPTDKDRVRALGVPWYLTRVVGTLWIAATLLFTMLAVILQPGRAFSTAFAVGITTVVVSAVAYLLAEFSLRPIAARALQGEQRVTVRGLGVRRRMLLFWAVGTGAPVFGLIVVALFALVQQDVTPTKISVTILVLGSVVLVFGALVTSLNARAVVAPILAVRNGMQRVEAHELETEVQVYDGTELGQLQAGFNQMVHGLREREHLRDMFGRHVGKEVAAAAASKDVELGGETRVVSVLFVDIVGSTTLATEREPAEVVALLNRFFGVVVEEVDAAGGLVNKFIGDAVLAVFGAPVELEDHAGKALAAARRIAERLADEVPELAAGIGVATGEAVAGNVGQEHRFEYTVIGDAVNSAARLTDLAKDVDGRLLAAWASVEAAGEEAEHWREHDAVTLRGRSEETPTAVPR